MHIPLINTNLKLILFENSKTLIIGTKSHLELEDSTGATF